MTGPWQPLHIVDEGLIYPIPGPPGPAGPAGPPGPLGALVTREDLADAPPSSELFYLGEMWREGWFRWTPGNLSSVVLADPQQGIYVPPTSQPDGSAGAWKRVTETDILQAQWFGVYPAALGTPVASVPDRATELQAALNLAAFLGGGIVENPTGMIAVGTTLSIDDYTEWRGKNSDTSIVVEMAALTGPLIENASFPTADGGTGTNEPRVRHLGFDGTLRPSANWLSKLDGTPITDPQADYLPGGCLSPTTPATITLILSNGEITGVTIVNGGAGYVYPPTVWITGNGIGAAITVFISGGAVTSSSITLSGKNYTTATAQVVGGGADPQVAFYANDRRNPNFSDSDAVIKFTKANKPLIEHCAFRNHFMTVISDLGSESLVIRNNLFENGGQTDWLGNCVWSQSRGDPDSPGVDFRWSTNTVFESNIVRDWRRSVMLMGGINQRAINNDVDGWGECCFYPPPNNAGGYQVIGNRVKRGRITDITNSFVESHTHGCVRDNIIEDCDGAGCIVFTPGPMEITRNTFIAPPSYVPTIPFGPFSERVAFGHGQEATAGTQRPLSARCPVRIVAAADAAASTKAVTIGFNHIEDPGGLYESLVMLTGGAHDSIGDILIIGNDLSNAPSLSPYDAEGAAAFVDPARRLTVIHSLGSATSAPGIDVSELIPGNDLINAIENGTLEKGPAGWAVGGDSLMFIENDPTNARNGNWVAHFHGIGAAAVDGSYLSSNRIAVSPGDTVYFEAWSKTSSSVVGSSRLMLIWANKDDGFLSSVSSTAFGDPPQTTYAKKTLTAVAPAATQFVRFRMITYMVSGDTWFDSAFGFRLRPANTLVAGSGVAVTGSRAGNAALASLLTALAGTGIIVDSSTA
jgi:hypothetical protein